MSDMQSEGSDLVPLTVSVPRHTIPDLYAFVATLHAGGGAPGNSDDATGKDAAPKKRAADGFGAATVRKNYLGGVSGYWRPFLDRLAANPGEWLAWSDLCDFIGMTPRQASGMLGAAERRCKGFPPYEKVEEDGEHWFRMPAGVAAVIREVAGSHADPTDR